MDEREDFDAYLDNLLGEVESEADSDFGRMVLNKQLNNSDNSFRMRSIKESCNAINKERASENELFSSERGERHILSCKIFKENDEDKHREDE